MTKRLVVPLLMICRVLSSHPDRLLTVTGSIERSDASILLRRSQDGLSFAPPDRLIHISVIANGETRDCTAQQWPSASFYDAVTQRVQTVKKPPNGLCAATVPDGTDHVRIEIASPGYETYSKNIASLTTGLFGRVTVDLGTVTLVRLPLPSIEQVLLFRTDEGAYRFQVAIQNDLSEPFTIRELTLEGESPQAPTCFEPFRYTYSLGRVLVAAKTAAYRHFVRGKLYDLSSNKPGSITVSGTLVSTCPGAAVALALTMPIFVGLPPKRCTLVELEIPARIEIRTSDGSGTQERQRPSTTMPRWLRLSQLFSYEFTFQLGGGASLEGFYRADR